MQVPEAEFHRVELTSLCGQVREVDEVNKMVALKCKRGLAPLVCSANPPYLLPLLDDMLDRLHTDRP